MERIQKQQGYQDEMNFKREQEVNRMSMTREQNSIKQSEIQSRQSVAEKQLEIARVNKNKYDAPKSKDKKK